MEKSLLLGNEAVARAAYDAGAAVASAYPGTPSTEITENLAKYPDIYCEWAPNEKVALETALGASIAGARAICAMKHVGLNVAADPLFTASYTGVNGGLVIMAADDPGMHSSQNEQDSRYYGLSAKVPVLEPADSQECYDFVKAAFELSERFDTPVIVRLTTRVAHSRSLVAAAPGSGAGGATGRGPVPLKPYRKDVGKYVMMPAMARGRHVEVEKRMRALGEYAETCAQNTIGGRDGAAACASGGAAVDASASGGAGSSSGRAVKKAPFGVITSGMAWQYTREALGESDVPILKLGLVHPLPKQKITDFAARVERLAVVEELSPFIEDFVKGLGVPVTGKSALPEIGELSAALVSGALKKLGKDESGAPAAASDSAVSAQKSASASAPVFAASTPKSASASAPVSAQKSASASAPASAPKSASAS
ncbi:MAG: hypothetical protein LBU58_08315, partial [Clostridiales bacterium]|nr:hypothetical protein [Clostridiales bacterium]